MSYVTATIQTTKHECQNFDTRIIFSPKGKEDALCFFLSFVVTTIPGKNYK
jgi:hypothetical protein